MVPPVFDLGLEARFDEPPDAVLAFPGDDAEGGLSSNEEISTLAITAGFLASSYELFVWQRSPPME